MTTFAQTLGKKNYHVDAIAVIDGFVGTGVTTLRIGVGLCVAVSMVSLGFESVGGPCGVFAPS